MWITGRAAWVSVKMHGTMKITGWAEWSAVKMHGTM